MAPTGDANVTHGNSHQTRGHRVTQREVHLRDLAAVVQRHWRIVALVALLVSAGAWYSGRRAVPQYESRLTVQISSPKQVFAEDNRVDVNELALKTDPVLSETLVLTTQGLALRVVDALHLQLEMTDPTLHRAAYFADVVVDSLAPPGLYELRRLGSAGYEVRDAAGRVVAKGGYDEPAVGPGFAVRIVPSTHPDDVRFSIVPPAQAASWVSAGLSYRVREGTNAVDIYYTGSDQEMVPRILNEAAVQLRINGAQRARAVAARKREYIGVQLAKANEALRAKQRELQQFKEHREVADLSAEEEALIGTIKDYEQQRQSLLVRITTLDNAVSDTTPIGIETLNRLSALENVAKNPALSFQIQNLLDLYEKRRTLTAGELGLRENNPQVSAIDQRIREANEALRQAVKAAQDVLALQRTGLDKKIADARAQLKNYPGMETQIAQLSLEADIQEQTTRYLLGQYESARLTEATIAPYIAILDGAAPAYRIGTSMRQKVILGLLVGILLGLAGAFFLEYLDQTIKSTQDLDRALGVPVLGLIPHDVRLGGQHNGKHSPITVITSLSPDEPAVEAYRTLRTNVTFVGAEKPLQFIALTSPGPGEGKSTTAANLAVALAQGDSRTILIDGDLRRPLVHRAFALVQEPGLTDVLLGTTPAREAIRPDVAPNLDVLPAGTSPPNPSELLGSEAMHKLIADLRRDYEYIIMDTPPTLPVTDATVIATAADAMILTIRSGETEETAAQRALEQLRRVNARIAGAVLNGIDRARDHYYQYYSYERNIPYRSRSSVASLRSRIAKMF